MAECVLCFIILCRSFDELEAEMLQGQKLQVCYDTWLDK